MAAWSGSLFVMHKPSREPPPRCSVSSLDDAADVERHQGQRSRGDNDVLDGHEFVGAVCKGHIAGAVLQRRDLALVDEQPQVAAVRCGPDLLWPRNAGHAVRSLHSFYEIALGRQSTGSELSA